MTTRPPAGILQANATLGGTIQITVFPNDTGPIRLAIVENDATYGAYLCLNDVEAEQISEALQRAADWAKGGTPPIEAEKSCG